MKPAVQRASTNSRESINCFGFSLSMIAPTNGPCISAGKNDIETATPIISGDAPRFASNVRTATWLNQEPKYAIT